MEVRKFIEKVLEGYGRSWKVMEGHEKSYKVMKSHTKSINNSLIIEFEDYSASASPIPTI